MTTTTKLIAHRDTFDRLVEESIATNTVHRGLRVASRRVGADYNEVVDHIISETSANRSAGAARGIVPALSS